MTIRRIWMALGAAVGLSLMAVAALTLETPVLRDGDFGKVSEDMAAL